MRKPRKIRRVRSAEVTGNPTLQLNFSICVQRGTTLNPWRSVYDTGERKTVLTT